MDGHEFRLWLALHETTHAFEFEAFPWVRPHFNTLLERYIVLVTEDLRNLQGGLSTFVRRLREQGGSGKSLMEIVMTPEQKQLFDEMQALMSVVEGYSNHVMNAVGKQILPSLDTLQRAFESRSRQRSQAETLFIRLTGLEMKMEQYRLGEQFIDAVVRERGPPVRPQSLAGAGKPAHADRTAQPEAVDRAHRTPGGDPRTRRIRSTSTERVSWRMEDAGSADSSRATLLSRLVLVTRSSSWGGRTPPVVVL